MSRARTMIDYVIANPGCSSGDITDHLCALEHTSKRQHMAATVSAQLSQQFARRKLRRTGQAMAYRWWPTKLSQVDLRSHTRDGKPKVAKPPTKPAAKRKPAPARKVAQVVRYASPMATKPKPASQVQVVDRTRKAAPRPNGVHPETVEQFLARGGRIQRVGPNDAAQPLRFDHSQAQVPPKRRAPLRRRNANAS